MGAVDPRPANCRHRLQDEGKSYPRSSCAACGKGIATGLGTHCTAVLPTPLPVTRERVGIKQLEWREILTHGGGCLSASFHGRDWRIPLRLKPAQIEAEKVKAQAEFEAMIVSAFARLDDVGDAALTHPTGERITRRDLNNAHRLGREEGQEAAELLPLAAFLFQPRVKPWLDACFGPEIAADKAERNHRFIEEALELVQSTGCTQSEAHQLVDYVFGREIGDPDQEVGGVMITLAALCLAHGLDMHDAAERELERIWAKVEQIRAKQAAKPKHSPLPA